jgi:hypothetical protein
MALLRNSKDTFEATLKVLRVLQDMTAERQMQVLAAVQMVVSTEMQAPQLQTEPEVSDE